MPIRHPAKRRSDRQSDDIDRHVAGSRGWTLKQPDAKDQQILSILSREARIPLKTLAARIGLSRSATSERVAQLERSGIIRGYRADIGHIDQDVVRAFLQVTLTRTPSMGILDKLAGYAEVRRVSSISGQIDLVVELEVASIDRLNSLRDAIAKTTDVQDLTTLIVLRRDIERSE